MNIEHISISRYGTFKECKQRYKYRYHLKTPSTLPEQFYFTYGKIVHKIAEVYVEKRGEIIIGEIAQDVLRGKIEIESGKKAPPLLPEYSKKLPSHLASIQNLTEKIGYDGKLEYLFKYDLDPPKNKFITGVIDRFILKDDKAFIIDYKTTKKGNWRKNSSNIMYDLQLRTYAKVIQKEYNVKAENIKAALYYLEGGNLIATSFTQNLIDKAEEELHKAYLDIEQTDPDKVYGTTGYHCSRCDYNNICPFYAIKI